MSLISGAWSVERREGGKWQPINCQIMMNCMEDSLQIDHRCGSFGRLTSGADDSLVVHKPGGSEVSICAILTYDNIKNANVTASVSQGLTNFIVSSC